MKKIKWEHILLFFLELLVNMATVGVAILLNALIDAAQISITSQDAHHLQKVLFISILYAVCLGVLVFLSNRYKACYIRKRLLEMRTVLADGTLQSSIANYEETGNASYVTAFNQNFSIIEEKVLHLRCFHPCIFYILRSIRANHIKCFFVKIRIFLFLLLAKFFRFFSS